MMDNNMALLEDQTCPTVGYQSASICVPVTVSPFAKTGATFTKCCGAPVVTPGKITCDGERNGSCVFTISQDICVAVPVEFGATATKLPPKISAPIAANSKFLRQNKPFTKSPDSFRGFFLFEGIFLYLDNPLCLE